MWAIALILTDSEWQKVQARAAEQWPQERLSNAEICRRFALIGTQYAHTADAKELRATQTAPEPTSQ